MLTVSRTRPGARWRERLNQAAFPFRGAGPGIPVVLAVVAAAVAAPILIRLSAPGAGSDIPAHAAMAAQMVRSGGWFSYTLWYPLIYFTSSGSTDPVLLREISVLFLMVFVVAKTLLVFYVAWAYTRRLVASVWIAMLMLVAMPVLNPWRAQDIYLGQLSPNVWHNSTQIFALPFSLAAFVAAAALLRVPSRSRALAFGVLVFMSTLAKPNYTLALVPVLGLMLLWTMRGAKTPKMVQLAVIFLAFLPTVLLLASQYVLVFGGNGVRKTDLGLAPLAVWGFYSKNVAVSVGLSVAGPLAVLLALPRKWRKDPAVVLAWLVCAFSTLQLALLAERSRDGTISLEGNFFWGTYSAVFMVFIACTFALVGACRDGMTSPGRRVALHTACVVLVLHAGTGLYYLGHAWALSSAYV